MTFLFITKKNISLLGTMSNWLHICGFKVSESKKGIYYDGHERDDVVEVRGCS